MAVNWEALGFLLVSTCILWNSPYQLCKTFCTSTCSKNKVLFNSYIHLTHIIYPLCLYRCMVCYQLFWPRSCLSSLALRYAYSGDPAAGHPAHAGQRAAALLLRLLHIRHRRRPAVGRSAQKPLLCGGHLPLVSSLFTASVFWLGICASASAVSFSV